MPTCRPTGFLHYTIEDLPVRLIALDTLVPGKGYGALCAERLDWLEARLGESDRPTVLFMHHPPFDCGIDAFDGMRLNEGGERLAEIVRRHDNVERVMCGHVHRPIQVRWAGTMASIAPSTAHQATLDLHDRAPLSMMMEPPGIALHLWRPGTGLVTHVSYIGTYDGPRPFRSTAMTVAQSRLGGRAEPRRSVQAAGTRRHHRRGGRRSRAASPPIRRPAPRPASACCGRWCSPGR